MLFKDLCNLWVLFLVIREICRLNKRIMFLRVYIVPMHVLNFGSVVSKCESLKEHRVYRVALF